MRNGWDERKADRIGKVREYVDRVIGRIPDREIQKEAFIHLYGVSQACGLIAMKRGEDAELAVIAGMLHDIWRYSRMESRDHAHKGAGLVRDILIPMGLFEEWEVEKICHAVYHHSGKGICQEPFDEVLKDGDVFEHFMFDPTQEPKAKEFARFLRLRAEFGLGDGEGDRRR